MSTMEVLMTDNLLIENAILAFLHHYPNHKWAGEYAKLLDKIKSIENAKSEDAEVRKRGRPAKRQRKKETTSDKTSEEENQTT